MFYMSTKIMQIEWGHHVDICVWKKSGIIFGEGCMRLGIGRIFDITYV